MKTLNKSAIFAGILAAVSAAPPASATPSVVVSLKPIHSLVLALMDGVATPGLILKGAASPHTYQMKPSDAAELQGANFIFWIGPGMEKFMEKPLASLGAKAKIVELDKAPGLVKLPTRESGTFEPHDDGDAAPAPGEVEYDAHLWLSTANAKVMASEIEKTLVDSDPANAQFYAANLEKLNRRLDALSAEIRGTVAPIKDRPFIVFHDAYQYFEKEFGVDVAGSITVSPENVPGARRISEIHDKVKSLGATCVFAEPQFEPKLVNVVLEGTRAKTGTLDPEASTYPASADLYFNMMRGIAGSLKTCLDN
jgi:zinc transport system substrate-binding protein